MAINTRGLDVAIFFFEPNISNKTVDSLEKPIDPVPGNTLAVVSNSKTVSNNDGTFFLFHHLGLYYRLTSINSGYVQVPIPKSIKELPFRSGEGVEIYIDNKRVFLGYVREVAFTEATSGYYATVSFASGFEIAERVSFLYQYQRAIPGSTEADVPIELDASDYFKVLMSCNYLRYSSFETDLTNIQPFRLPMSNSAVRSVIESFIGIYGRLLYQKPDGTVCIKKLAPYTGEQPIKLEDELITSYSYRDQSMAVPTQILNTFRDTAILSERLVSSRAEISIYRNNVTTRADSWTLVQSLTVPANKLNAKIQLDISVNQIPGYIVWLTKENTTISENPMVQLGQTLFDNPNTFTQPPLRSGIIEIPTETTVPPYLSGDIAKVPQTMAQSPTANQDNPFIKLPNFFETTTPNQSTLTDEEKEQLTATFKPKTTQSSAISQWATQSLFTVATLQASQGYVCSIRYAITGYNVIPEIGQIVEIPESRLTGYNQRLFLVMSSQIEINAGGQICALELAPINTLMPDFIAGDGL